MFTILIVTYLIFGMILANYGIEKAKENANINPSTINLIIAFTILSIICPIPFLFSVFIGMFKRH